ncbi:MAG TPA: hypothetical protein PK167_03470 [Prolixibacteraceae bacterium]|nr:hypothetical protein [Prolixibacteraceae bacterium]
MRITPVEFFEMRVCHFFAALEEYTRAQENSKRVFCETTRLQTTFLVNINLKKEDQLRPTQLWTLPWDTKPQPVNEDSLMKTSQKLLDLLDNM